MLYLMVLFNPFINKGGINNENIIGIDRMLIAQSIVEPMRLLTHDDTLIQYGKHVLLV